MSYPIYNTDKLVQLTIKELNHIDSNYTPIGDNQYILIDTNNLNGYYLFDVILEFNQKFNFNLLQQRVTDINDNKVITYSAQKFNGKNYSKQDRTNIRMTPSMMAELIIKCRPEYLQIINFIRLKIIKEG